ncbi:hypothetical protein EON65_51535 [archaeon]|nr:MAG: hypothetical protein EON65_51535 [archaeon]
MPQLLQVFDSWAGELTPHQFQTFALPPLLSFLFHCLTHFQAYLVEFSFLLAETAGKFLGVRMRRGKKLVGCLQINVNRQRHTHK